MFRNCLINLSSVIIFSSFVELCVFILSENLWRVEKKIKFLNQEFDFDGGNSYKKKNINQWIFAGWFKKALCQKILIWILSVMRDVGFPVEFWALWLTVCRALTAGLSNEDKELLETFGAVFVNLNPGVFKQIITKHIDVSSFKCYFFKKSLEMRKSQWCITGRCSCWYLVAVPQYKWHVICVQIVFQSSLLICMHNKEWYIKGISSGE